MIQPIPQPVQAPAPSLASTIAASPIATSIAVTGVGALSAVQGGQLIEWLANSVLHMQMPENVALTIGAAAIPLVHSIYNHFIERLSTASFVTPQRLALAESALSLALAEVANLQAQRGRAPAPSPDPGPAVIQPIPQPQPGPTPDPSKAPGWAETQAGGQQP